MGQWGADHQGEACLFYSTAYARSQIIKDRLLKPLPRRNALVTYLLFTKAQQKYSSDLSCERKVHQRKKERREGNEVEGRREGKSRGERGWQGEQEKKKEGKTVIKKEH